MKKASSYISPEEIEAIHSKYTVLDYFKRLEMEGKVKFHRKTGHDYYFLTPENKFSISDSKFYDFKLGEGGQLIKAVMLFENKTWKEALDRLKTSAAMPNIEVELKPSIKSSSKSKKPKIISIHPPKNKKLMAYFKERNISRDILSKYTKEISYKIDDKYYYGIGIQNDAGGYEIRNPFMKSKLGANGISTLKGEKEDEILLFEGMTDRLSFLQLLKDNGKKNSRTLITLNSITNTPKFIEQYKDFEGKLYLCLDGDPAGDRTTNKITEDLSKAIITDVRKLYNINTHENNDLNDYLKSKAQTQKKALTEFKDQSNLF